MPKKKHASINVPMIKTTDAEDRLVIDSLGIQSTFDPDGTLTFNGTNGVLTWNSGDVTHLNFTIDNFAIMFDAESRLITMTAGEKNIFYQLDDLIKQILEKGYTIEEMEKILAETENDTQKGDEQNGDEETDQDKT